MPKGTRGQPEPMTDSTGTDTIKEGQGSIASMRKLSTTAATTMIMRTRRTTTSRRSTSRSSITERTMTSRTPLEGTRWTRSVVLSLVSWTSNSLSNRRTQATRSTNSKWGKGASILVEVHIKVPTCNSNRTAGYLTTGDLTPTKETRELQDNPLALSNTITLHKADSTFSSIRTKGEVVTKILHQPRTLSQTYQDMEVREALITSTPTILISSNSWIAFLECRPTWATWTLKASPRAALNSQGSTTKAPLTKPQVPGAKMVKTW